MALTELLLHTTRKGQKVKLIIWRTVVWILGIIKNSCDRVGCKIFKLANHGQGAQNDFVSSQHLKYPVIIPSKYFLSKVIHRKNISTMANIMTACFTSYVICKRSYFRLHQAINYAETLPLKVKDTNEVNEDLSVLLTTTMTHKERKSPSSCMLRFVCPPFYRKWRSWVRDSIVQRERETNTCARENCERGCTRALCETSSCQSSRLRLKVKSCLIL